MKWLKSANVMVAEVTIPSLGVGYELGIAEILKIPVLCLEKGKKLSAMVKGNNHISCQEYHNLTEAHLCIDAFIKSLDYLGGSYQ